jgi:ABC-type nitrate/sulfonate/bicarbonate transport system substrate-binding protein
LDPGKDVNLVTMGGDSVRFPALQTKAISATLFNTGMSLQAQKAGFTKLASAADYANLIEGGFAAGSEKLKQNPDKTARFIRASLKGIKFYATKREPSIKLMMRAMKTADRELVSAIYDINSKLIRRDGYSDDKTLQGMIDAMKQTTKVTRDIKVSDIFDLTFVKRANDELTAAGWKP